MIRNYIVDVGKCFKLEGVLLVCFLFPGVLVVKHSPLFLKLQNSRTKGSLMPLIYLPGLSGLSDYRLCQMKGEGGHWFQNQGRPAPTLPEPLTAQPNRMSNLSAFNSWVNLLCARHCSRPWDTS